MYKIFSLQPKAKSLPLESKTRVGIQRKNELIMLKEKPKSKKLKELFEESLQ